MLKATNVSTGKVKGVWFAFADLGELQFQERFDKKPTKRDVKNAIESFEFNYNNLTPQEREPQTGKARRDKV